MSEDVYTKLKEQNGTRFAKVFKDEESVLAIPGLLDMVRNLGSSSIAAKAVLPALKHLAETGGKPSKVLVSHCDNNIVKSKLDAKIEMVDGKFMLVLMDVNGVLIGERCYSENKTTLIELEPHEYLFDHFVYDDKSKMMRDVANTPDCFPEVFNRYYGGNEDLYVKNNCLFEGSTMLIGV